MLSRASRESFAFGIQDNPDVASLIYYGYDKPGDNGCEDLLPAAEEPDIPSFIVDYGYPITTGNIMIHPAS